jgi:putative molybdopterin biosynthesis protein
MKNNQSNQRDFLTVKEVAALLSLNEKKIYALALQGRLPGTKITGKWLFPRRELEDLLRRKARSAMGELFQELALDKKIVLVAGSDDPALPVVHGLFHRMYPDYALFSSSVGSAEGLLFLKRGFCHVALSHLYDEKTGDYTFPFIREVFDAPGELVLVNLFHRSVGFVAKGEGVDSFRTVAGRGLRFVNRQKGSGIRGRIDALLAAEGVEPSAIRGYGEESYTHVDVAERVADGSADAGIAAESVARFTGLRFTRLFQERFDMVTHKESFFDENVQVFLEFIRSGEFRGRIADVPGYDCRETGKVLYPKGE